MATQRSSSNIFWTTITSLVAGELLTKARLYTEALHRLQDNDGALLGRIARVYSDLVSQAVGTKARIVGNVDMTGFNYDGGVALSGLTVIVDENTTTAQTCTFTNAVTGPDVLLSQLTSQAGTNLIWSLNDSGQLVCECQTIGGTSTIALGAGTAHSTIWPSPTITTPGAGTANDGASRVGIGAFASWGGGTLRDFLVAFESAASATATAVALKVAKAGDTVTGPLIFSGSTARVVYREPVTLSGSTSTLTLNFDFGIVPDAATPRTYTIPAATSKGQWFVVRRNVVGGGNNVVLQRVSTTQVGVLPNTGIGWILFVAQDDGGGNAEWSAWAWGGDATPL